MSEYTALRGVSETLKALLESHITNSADADITGVPIETRSPQELDADNVTTAVSLWLFRASMQPDLLNRRPTRLPGGDQAHEPLPLELAYLVTAMHPTTSTELALTGRVAQVFHDHRRLRGADLRDSLAGEDTELHVTLDTSSLADSANLWYSLLKPYRLCLSLRVQGVEIDSHLPAFAGGPPVLERVLETAQIVSEG